MNERRKGALPQPQDYAPIEPLTHEVSNEDCITSRIINLLREPMQLDTNCTLPAWKVMLGSFMLLAILYAIPFFCSILHVYELLYV